MLARSVCDKSPYNFSDFWLFDLICLYAVPHFEKMLYDQGQLVNVYLDVFSLTKDVFYSSLSRDILDYLRREMMGPSGEIFSAEDADSAEFEGASRKEGAFYVWTSQEVHICCYSFSMTRNLAFDLFNSFVDRLMKYSESTLLSLKSTTTLNHRATATYQE